MTQIVLNIDDDKYSAFIEFIKTLNYVSVSNEDSIPSWQKVEVEDRLIKIESGEMKTRSWHDAKKEIFKK